MIPSFNVEKYLRQTLESLRNEEILEDVEVLIVDDGSTDDTAKIGREYEKRYPQTLSGDFKQTEDTVQQSIAGSNRAEEHFSKSWMEMTGSIQRH